MEPKETSREDYPVHWLDGIAKKILKRNPNVITLATGKTPSGYIHLGIMRELLICDALRRVFEKQQKKVEYRLFLDSLDAAKRFPSYIPQDYAKKYIGQPFALIPNPFNPGDGKNYAQVFGEGLQATFPEMGIQVEVVWTNELYKTEEMKKMIRIGLEKNEEVKRIVAKYLTASMTEEQKTKYLEQQKDWMGAMVICEKCQCTQKKQKDGTILPNRVLSYNKITDEVSYHCPACGYKNNVKISSGLIKLNWRLDWPAKWTMFQTTCEPAGKDHCTPGGSYDTGLDLCQSIYGYEGPVKVSYEWLRLGDRDMKTSKGIVFTPEKYLSMVEPEILRMLIYQTNPNKHISFRIEELEQYYNELDRIERIYYQKETNISKEESLEIQYIYPLILKTEVPKEHQPRLPFKLMTTLAQLHELLGLDGIYKKAEEFMTHENFQTHLTKEDFAIQIRRVQNWVKEIATIISMEKNPQQLKKLKSKVVIFSIPKNISTEILQKLDASQKEALKMFLSKMDNYSELTNENIKTMMMEIRTELNMKPAKIFQALYYVFLAKKRGPRLGPLLSMLEKEWIKNRIASIFQE